MAKNGYQLLEQKLNKASLNAIKRVTSFFHQKAREAVGVPNSGVKISAKRMREQAQKQLGKRTKGLVSISHDKDVYSTESDIARYGTSLKTSRMWHDKSLNNNKRSATIYPYPSLPGEPPRKRTGEGQRSIQFEIDENVPAGRVGVMPGGKYMVYLNFGTKRVAARPWVETTLRKNEAAMAVLARSK